MNNRHTSGYFQPSRGIGQGCPISSLLLFILVAELFLISQLTDDTYRLFLKNTESLKSAISLIEQFHYVSGLKLNKKKNKVLYLGNTNPKAKE